MAQQFTTISDLYRHGFDTVIDVRSPAEFADDHVPGAINLPALSNAERAEVGTMYKQLSPFLARKHGASLVLRNVADHIATAMKDFDGSWRPLVYCWRGGQRSGVFSTLLKEVGWRADTIAGGYQTYRRLVNRSLYELPLPCPLILLDGYTGTAKTKLLALLEAKGVQTLDLEGLADHRGSLIGSLPKGQPSQKMFETRLAHAISKLAPERPVLVEAESSKIGRINLPPSLWTAMMQAPRIVVKASIEARTDYLAEAYADILCDPSTVRKRLAPLRHVRGHAVVDRWQDLQDAQDYAGLARALITDHYDPAYDKSQQLESRIVKAEIGLSSLGSQELAKAADEIADHLK